MNLRTKLLAAFGAIAIAGLAAQAQVPGVNSTLNSVFTLAYDNSTMKPTYSSTCYILTIASTPTDICTLNGSASKTVKVRRVLFSALATTAVSEPVAIMKRSLHNQAGTATDPAVIPYDSNNATGTAYSTAYTANPSTLGTPVGTLVDPIFTYGNFTTGGVQTLASQVLFGTLGQPIVLRGVEEMLAVYLNGITVTSASAVVTFEWTEE